MNTSKQKKLFFQVTKLRHTILGLETFTEYNISVLAVNKNGEGESSDEITVRTLSDLPTDVPQNFTIKVVSTTVSYQF